MYRIFLIIILGYLSLLSVAAQKIKISEKEVARIVRTLSSDEMQGRKTFTPGIAKASAFIQDEFKKAGLKPLPGLNNYEQAFTMYRTEPVSLTVQLNGTTILPENLLVSTSAEQLTWSNSSANKPEIKNISSTDNFIQLAQALVNSPNNQLVLVDPAHVATFKRFQAYLGRSNMKMERSNNATIFVLTDQTEAKDYQVLAQNKLTEQKINNVVGYLPGKTRPQEYVIFSAHYDHLGFVKAVNGDSIANGADDDASGTTAVITLARHFGKRKNERSIMFVAFAAEEIGGYGARYFSQQLDPNQITAMFNIEMIGKESQFGKNAGFITGFERSDFGTIVQKNLAGTNYQFHPDPYVKENLFYRSDNATLARLGVPAHSLSTDKIDTDKLYHSVDDEFESLDIANMTNIIKAIAKGAESIIAGQDSPTRIAPASR